MLFLYIKKGVRIKTESVTDGANAKYIICQVFVYILRTYVSHINQTYTVASNPSVTGSVFMQSFGLFLGQGANPPPPHLYLYPNRRFLGGDSDYLWDSVQVPPPLIYTQPMVFRRRFGLFVGQCALCKSPLLSTVYPNRWFLGGDSDYFWDSVQVPPPPLIYCTPTDGKFMSCSNMGRAVMVLNGDKFGGRQAS